MSASKQHPEELALSARFTSDHSGRVLAFVRANLDRTITVDDLAAQAGMSPSHLFAIRTHGTE